MLSRLPLVLFGVCPRPIGDSAMFEELSLFFFGLGVRGVNIAPLFVAFEHLVRFRFEL
jgi:hypothetical protein